MSLRFIRRSAILADIEAAGRQAFYDAKPCRSPHWRIRERRAWERGWRSSEAEVDLIVERAAEEARRVALEWGADRGVTPNGASDLSGIVGQRRA